MFGVRCSVSGACGACGYLQVPTEYQRYFWMGLHVSSYIHTVPNLQVAFMGQQNVDE